MRRRRFLCPVAAAELDPEGAAAAPSRWQRCCGRSSDYIKDLFEYLIDLALWLVSQVTFPLTYPIRYALYLMQLGLYEIYRQFRFALALSGFAFPDPDQLFHPLAQQFINPATDVQSMPRREFPVEQDHCLFFPAGCPIPQSPGCVEPVAATAGPYTRSPLNYPFWFIEGEPFDPVVAQALADADSPGKTIELTRSLFPPKTRRAVLQEASATPSTSCFVTPRRSRREGAVPTT